MENMAKKVNIPDMENMAKKANKKNIENMANKKKIFGNLSGSKKPKTIELKGGSIKNNIYDYIVNPKNGRKISIYTKLGRKIIQKYKKNI